MTNIPEHSKIEELETKAQIIEERTDRLVTKKQMFAYFLTEVVGMTVEEAGDVMKLANSSVSKHKIKAEDKINNVYLLHEILEKDPFWAGVSLEEFKDD